MKSTAPETAVPDKPEIKRFASFDGVSIAWREMGSGRPTLLLHGFMADGPTNWIGPGVAAALAAKGRRVIMPDFRGHGASDKPEDPGAYPVDALALDQEALLANLGITDYDLLTYSQGARTGIRMLDRGARPRRVILGGMGDTGIIAVDTRRNYFIDLITNGENARNPQAGKFAQARLRHFGMSQATALGVQATIVNTSPERLARLDMPILVLCGETDEDNGNAEALAALLPNAKAKRIGGSHITAISDPEFIPSIVDFLDG